MSRLPEALLATSPRARPAAYPSRWVARLGAAGLGVLALVAGVMALDHAATLDAGQGAAAGGGTVTGTRIQRSSRSYKSHWVTFQHGGRSSSCLVHGDDLDGLRAGQELPYWIHRGLMRTQTLLEPCARHARTEARRVAIMLGLFAPLALAGAVLVLRRAGRKHRLLTEGVPAAGRVLGVRHGVRGQIIVELEVAPPVSFQGRRIVGRRLLRRLGGGQVPQAGDAAYVVYDRARPARFELWGFGPGPGASGRPPGSRERP
jgi:hypothetical protein